MNTLIIIILLVVVAALCLHNYRIARVHEHTVDLLRKQLLDLGSDMKPDAFDHIDPSTFKPEMQITVRVKDPIALAKREDKMARMFADFLPALIIQKVYEQVRDEVIQGLVDENVDADVDIEVIAISTTTASRSSKTDKPYTDYRDPAEIEEA